MKKLVIGNMIIYFEARNVDINHQDQQDLLELINLRLVIGQNQEVSLISALGMLSSELENEFN